MSTHLSKPDFAKQVFNTAVKMVSLADSKANLTITVQSLIFSIGLGATLASKVLDFVPNLKSIYYWLFIILCIVLIISTLIGIISALLVYYDRIRKPKTERKTMVISKRMKDRYREKWEEKIKKNPYLIRGVGNLYFKHIQANFPDVDNYVENILDGYIGTNTDLLKEHALQIHSVSKTLVIKFRFVNRSIAFLVWNLIFAALLIVADGVILLTH